MTHSKPTFVCLPLMLLLMACIAGSSPVKAQDAAPETQTLGTNAAVEALCGKRVALIGESSTHGFGDTLRFKTQLVRRLVEQCHVNAIFFESGFYDFIHIERELRSGRDVPASTISAAMGGLWANAEAQSLAPFLRDEVKTGRLTLGGLDDQIGAGSYASRQMSSDLVQSLAGAEQLRCRSILERHMLWQYTENQPYRPSDKERIVGCLSEIDSQFAQAREQTQSTEESRAMVASLQRNFARNFTEDDFTSKVQEKQWFNYRDRSMYGNFEWLLRHLPPQSKIIVWAATVHTAKDLSGIAGFADRVPLGSYIHKDWNEQAFSLGFTAYSGRYAFTHQPVRLLDAAPPSSLEAHVFAHNSSTTAYLSGSQLQSYGAIPARLLALDFNVADWDRVVDGLVLFRVEYAPTWISPAKPITAN